MARKPGKKQKENPAGWAGESNRGEDIREKRTVNSAKFEFCDEITRRRCDEEGRGVG